MTPRVVLEVHGIASRVAHGHRDEGGKDHRAGPSSVVLARIGRSLALERGMSGVRGLVAKFFIHHGKDGGPERNDR
jgi:hypothetical protein